MTAAFALGAILAPGVAGAAIDTPAAPRGAVRIAAQAADSAQAVTAARAWLLLVDSAKYQASVDLAGSTLPPPASTDHAVPPTR